MKKSYLVEGEGSKEGTVGNKRQRKIDPKNISKFSSLLFTDAHADPRAFFAEKKAENKKMSQSSAATLKGKKNKSSRNDNVESVVGADADVDDHYHDFGEDITDNPHEGHSSSASSFQHTPNGLDVLFGIIQRNPTIMYPPENRFEARDIAMDEVVSLCKPFGGCCRTSTTSGCCSTGHDGVLSGSSETDMSHKSSTSVPQKSLLEEITSQGIYSDNSQYTIVANNGPLASQKDHKESQLQKMMALLGQRLSVGSATAHCSVGSSAKGIIASEVSPARRKDHDTVVIDVPTRDDVVANRNHESILHAATYHHKQLDAYIACLYEFNDTVFDTLPLKDTLFQMHKLGIKGQAHLAAFEEHCRGTRKAELIRRMKEDIVKLRDMSQVSDAEQLTESLTIRDSSTAAKYTALSEYTSTTGGPEKVNKSPGTGLQEDDYFDAMIAEAEENARKVECMGLEDDINEEDLAMQATLPIGEVTEMDPYQYMMIYGMPPT